MKFLVIRERIDGNKRWVETLEEEVEDELLDAAAGEKEILAAAAEILSGRHSAGKLISVEMPGEKFSMGLAISHAQVRPLKA